MHPYEDLLIDILLDSGFTLAEAERLIALQVQIDDATARERPWLLPHDFTDPPMDSAALN